MLNLGWCGRLIDESLWWWPVYTYNFLHEDHFLCMDKFLCVGQLPCTVTFLYLQLSMCWPTTATQILTWWSFLYSWAWRTLLHPLAMDLRMVLGMDFRMTMDLKMPLTMALWMTSRIHMGMSFWNSFRNGLRVALWMTYRMSSGITCSDWWKFIWEEGANQSATSIRCFQKRFWNGLKFLWEWLWVWFRHGFDNFFSNDFGNGFKKLFGNGFKKKDKYSRSSLTLWTFYHAVVGPYLLNQYQEYRIYHTEFIYVTVLGYPPLSHLVA